MNEIPRETFVNQNDLRKILPSYLINEIKETKNDKSEKYRKSSDDMLYISIFF